MSISCFYWEKTEMSITWQSERKYGFNIDIYDKQKILNPGKLNGVPS